MEGGLHLRNLSVSTFWMTPKVKFLELEHWKGSQCQTMIDLTKEYIKCIDLTKECLKILAICYSYNQKLKTKKKLFKGRKKDRETVLKLRGLKNLTLEGKITIFKSLALSTLFFQLRLCQFRKKLLAQLKRFTES